MYLREIVGMKARNIKNGWKKIYPTKSNWILEMDVVELAEDYLTMREMKWITIFGGRRIVTVRKDLETKEYIYMSQSLLNQVNGSDLYMMLNISL